MPTPPLKLQPVPPLQCGTGASSPAASPAAQEGLCPSDVGSTRTQKKTRVPPSYYTVLEVGKQLAGEEGSVIQLESLSGL